MRDRFQELWKKLGLALAYGSLLWGVMLAQTLEPSYQPGLDFSKYYTYRWVASKGAHPDPNVDAEIRELIDHQLIQKGLAKAADTADLYVDYQVAISVEMKWATYEDWTSVLVNEPRRTQDTINVGTLVIDMYDPAGKQLIWTRRANKTFDPNSSHEERKKIVDKTVKALLKSFPPKK